MWTRKPGIKPIPERVRAPDHVKGHPETGEMYETLVRLASRPEVRTVIEIGSTDGLGSTQALREGLERNPNYPRVRLCCIEPVAAMFERLRLGAAPYMRCYRVSSVPPELHYTDDEIRQFFAEDYPRQPYVTPEQKQDPAWHIRERDRYIEYFLRYRLPLDGIELIKREERIQTFDLALVDGSTYTGRADMRAVYGARYLVLDDVHTLKCCWAFRDLERDPAYRRIMYHPCTSGHFGYAAFERIDREEATA